MIDVIFKRKNNFLVSFNINGHADYSDSGTDIVCSAVSALSYTFANGITDVVKVSAKVELLDGYLNLDLSHLDETELSKCQVLMETMLLGIKSMEINYGKYIKVYIGEV